MSSAPTIALSLAAWCLMLAGSFGIVAEYSTTAGDQRTPPAVWPRDSALHSAAGRSTLVMFMHPRCPCSRASLAELEAIVSAAPDRALIYVVFMRPDGAGAEWEDTDVWASAGRIEGVYRVVDRTGEEIERFNARTSGLVLLYDAHGELRFSGGITASRGHLGDNVGRRTVIGLLNGDASLEAEHPVYGCALHDAIESGSTR